tara:strand:- start:2232 stop:2519 length:288 start_codon:yes stop_codon:yes gene_type:complete
MFSHLLGWFRFIKWTFITLFLLLGCAVGAVGVYWAFGDVTSPFAWLCIGSGFMCGYTLIMLTVLFIGNLPDYSVEHGPNPTLVKNSQGDHKRHIK